MKNAQFTPRWEPTQTKDDPPNKEEAVGQALGSASTCWGDDGAFDSVRAKEILDGLLFYLDSIQTPLLGLATTGELLSELRARAAVGGYLNYRTVDV